MIKLCLEDFLNKEIKNYSNITNGFDEFLKNFDTTQLPKKHPFVFNFETYQKLTELNDIIGIKKFLQKNYFNIMDPRDWILNSFSFSKNILGIKEWFILSREWEEKIIRRFPDNKKELKDLVIPYRNRQKTFTYKSKLKKL